MKTRIVCLGEAMVEERVGADGTVQRHYGGDTLNTAIHMARLGCDVAFASALGTDDESARLLSAWRDEGVDISLVLEHPALSAGRYVISLDHAGERSFTYDRDNSAARAMFNLADQSWIATIAQADLLFFSLISLAILPDAHRRRLLDLAQKVRANGGHVAFDGNYRARLWEGTESARRWRDLAIATADFGLPTLEDEIALSGFTNADEVAAHWQALGCSEVIVKQGAIGCLLPDGRIIAPAQVLSLVDSSGAGDAFDAGYLAARLARRLAAEAAMQGHRVAGWTIRRHGAIPPRDAEYPV